MIFPLLVPLYFFSPILPACVLLSFPSNRPAALKLLRSWTVSAYGLRSWLGGLVGPAPAAPTTESVLSLLSDWPGCTDYMLG